MKKYLVDWETCYCEDYPERMGSYVVEAENEEEAAKTLNVYHAVVIGVSEVNE